jgi:hypothetical protein
VYRLSYSGVPLRPWLNADAVIYGISDFAAGSIPVFRFIADHRRSEQPHRREWGPRFMGGVGEGPQTVYSPFTLC